MTLRLAVLGLGSVFSGPYARLIQEPALEGRADLVAGYDPDPAKVDAAARRFGLDPGATAPPDRLSSAEGRVAEIESDFPAPDYAGIEPSGADHRRAHDPRS